MRGRSNVPRMSPSPLHIAVYDVFIGADDAIAIADNDPITFRALESLLGRDFTVLWTELSGRTAVIRCVEDRQIPDVLLLDMALSDAPGPRVCRCLRANLDTMPILATTSYPLEAFAERAAENRAQGIVGKADIGAMARAIAMLAEGMVLPPPARCANAVFRPAARDHEEMLCRPLPWTPTALLACSLHLAALVGPAPVPATGQTPSRQEKGTRREGTAQPDACAHRTTSQDGGFQTRARAWGVRYRSRSPPVPRVIDTQYERAGR